LVDAVRPIEARPLAGFFARNGVLDSGLAEYFAGFAIVISYLYDPGQIFRENVARCSKAQFIAGPHRPDESAALHATEVFLRPLERLAIFASDPVPRLAPATARTPSAHQEHWLAAHPGSGSETKNWPESGWIELLDSLMEEPDRRLLLVGGEAEGGRLERLAASLPADRVAIARSLPLPLLARELARCDAFVGHDSGISHLASAVGVPVFVLWGETNQTIWQPRGSQVHLLHATAGLANLPASTVQRRFEEWWAGLATA
jgi:heptosyltransferase-2